MKIDIFNTNKKYKIIYADPPWKYRDNRCDGACEKYYKTMKLEEIKKLPVPQIAEKDCVLFLWTTYPQKQAIEVIEAWGFQYKTIGFQWVKKNKNGNGFFFGLGRWTRGNTEPCLIATKGKPQRVSNKVSQLILEPVGRHSAKPNVAREKIIELIGDESRIELFSRQQVCGWDCWGDEV